MQDESRASPKILIICHWIQRNSQAGYSILAIWAPRIQVLKRADEPSSYQQLSEGTISDSLKKM